MAAPGHRPSLLLINPWIYDFAAYDFFSRPLGLLSLAGWLTARGFAVHLADCLAGPPAGPGPFGTGRYPKEQLPTPPILAGVPRRWGRYGVSPAAFRERLSRVPRPAAILVTSLMTHWYPGVQAAIQIAREHFPGVPVILGGIYASLCPEHARAHSGADLVLTGPGEDSLPEALAHLGLPRPAPPDPAALDSWPYPALDLGARPTFIPVLTSRGCPFRCSYCAAPLLQPVWRRRSPGAVAAELLHWQAS